MPGIMDVPSARRVVMAMRHAEKPTGDGQSGGVRVSGRPDPTDLSVRGWQRAGALVAFFARFDGQDRIRRPSSLYAPKPTGDAPSVRGRSTLMPLSEATGIPISLEYARGQETKLARAVLSAAGPVLVVWQHTALIDFARCLVGRDVNLPSTWPEERYDMVWVFQQDDEAWSFAQVPHLLLAGDSYQLL